MSQTDRGSSPFTSKRILRGCAAGLLVGLVVGGTACGEEGVDGHAWEVEEPTARELFDSLQTGIYRAKLNIDVDECNPSIAELDASYDDWPTRLIPVNVSQSDIQGQDAPRKDVELVTPSPRHGELVELARARVTAADLVANEPLIERNVIFGGCESGVVENGIKTWVTKPGVIEVNFYVDYNHAPPCNFGRWSPDERCVEDFTFELEPVVLCDAGCVATGDFEEASWEGYNPTYPSAVDDSFGCMCD